MNRRDFFRGIGAAAASVALTPIPTALLPPGYWVTTGPLIVPLGTVSVRAFILGRLALHGINAPSDAELSVEVEGSTVHISVPVRFSAPPMYREVIEQSDREFALCILGRSVMEET